MRFETIIQKDPDNKGTGLKDKEKRKTRERIWWKREKDPRGQGISLHKTCIGSPGTGVYGDGKGITETRKEIPITRAKEGGELTQQQDHA